jgi:uncharacterized 2Fe-2S/4Fe-4S cluster protein (DUF4445 family)
MPTLTVRGGASGREIVKLTPIQSDLNQSLMDYLRRHGIPVASSCLGEGVCGKCAVNGGLLSCQISLRTLFQNQDKNVFVDISYL